MKQKKIDKKLVLNKKTITNLDSLAMHDVKGAQIPTYTAGITCGILCDTVNYSCELTQCYTDAHTCPATYCDTECGC